MIYVKRTAVSLLVDVAPLVLFLSQTFNSKKTSKSDILYYSFILKLKIRQSMLLPTTMQQLATSMYFKL